MLRKNNEGHKDDGNSRSGISSRTRRSSFTMSRPKLAMDTVAQFCDSSDSISFLDCSNNQAAATQRPAVAQRFVSDSKEEGTAAGDHALTGAEEFQACSKLSISRMISVVGSAVKAVIPTAAWIETSSEGVKQGTSEAAAVAPWHPLATAIGCAALGRLLCIEPHGQWPHCSFRRLWRVGRGSNALWLHSTHCANALLVVAAGTGTLVPTRRTRRKRK